MRDASGRKLTQREIDHMAVHIGAVAELGGTEIPTRAVYEHLYGQRDSYTRGYQMRQVTKALQKCESFGALNSRWNNGYLWSIPTDG